MLSGPPLGIRKRLCELNAEPRKRLNKTVSVLVLLIVSVLVLVSLQVVVLVPMLVSVRVPVLGLVAPWQCC